METFNIRDMLKEELQKQLAIHIEELYCLSSSLEGKMNNIAVLQQELEYLRGRYASVVEKYHVAVSLLCSNSATVICTDDGWRLVVEDMDDNHMKGSFSVQKSAYKAVDEGVKEYALYAQSVAS